MNKKYITKYSEKYYKSYDTNLDIQRDLNVTCITNGVIIPVIEENYDNDFVYKGGILDENLNFVKESSTYRDKPAKALVGGYNINKPSKYKDETVIYGGILYEFYGHVLLETMSRLWYYYKCNPNGYRVIFNVVPRARGKFKEIFELLDIPYDDNTFIKEPVQYKEVIVPEQATIYATSWHKDFLIPFEYMKSKIKPEKFEKIYFTRTKLTERNPVYGEKPIENLFKKNGYKVFSPEKLSLKKQIALMKGCKSLATVSSSTYHNLLFAENNVELICLNRSFQPDYSQHVVDQVKNIKYTYIDASLNPYPVSHVHGPWIIGYTKHLDNFCKDNNFIGLKAKYINMIQMNDIQRFIQKYSCLNFNKVYPLEEFEECTKNLNNIKINRTIIQYLYKIFSYFSCGRLKKKLIRMSKGDN